MKRNVLLATMLIAFGWSTAGCGGHADKDTYYCPMHPTYTSDRPGDCPICNMGLVKRETAKSQILRRRRIRLRRTNPNEKSQIRHAAGKSQISVAPPTVDHSSHAMSSQPGAEEKTQEQICIEHHCTMKNCPMIRAHLLPGERLICPVCGEYITTSSGKVVEISQKPAAPATGKKRILYYRNPMHPEVTSPVPMKDSMGMDYVPVYEKTPAGPGVYISPEKQQLIGVKIEPVKKVKLEKVIRATGKIAYDPELFVTQEEFVQALQNEDTLKNSPLKEKDAVEQARSLTEAARRKLRLLGMSDDQIAALQKKRKADSSLYLPSAGGSVWAYLWINEYEIGLVKTEDPVETEAVAYPGRKFGGRVAAINPTLDPATRANQIRVMVENREEKLKPEMFVNGTIHVDLGEKLAVPDTAVLDTGMRKIVYLSRPGGYLESREVTLGQKAEGYDEVLGGLSEGDEVVTSGNFLIDSESRLKAAPGATP